MMRFETAHWRLLRSTPADGAWNMALDEAILEQMERQDSLPTLRLYGWEPACLSLGYGQKHSEADLFRLDQHGWGIVRRPTGGRAILHADELTYSVITPLAEPRLAGNILESYQRISQALLLALRCLGLPVIAQDSPQESRHAGPVCFEVPSSYEITVEGKKLIGSAQARRKEGILQHGALPLTGDLTRITKVLVFENETEREHAARRLLERATTVEMALGRLVTWDDAANAFVNAFSEVLSIDFIPGTPTPQEETRARQLVNEKYAHPSWTERV